VVSIAVSKMGMTELIFVIPGMKVNGQYYRDVFSLSRCCQQSSMLQSGVLCSRVYECRMNSVGELKLWLIDV